MHRPEDLRRVQVLARGGLSHNQIARITGISRPTIRKWLVDPPKNLVRARCSTCGHLPHDFSGLSAKEYAYLLGIYLGDGSISRWRKGIWILRIVQDDRYPNIVDEIADAVRAVMPANVVRIDQKYQGANCVQISSCSRAWPCYFPQHGPGRKHERKIELTAWQWAYVWQEPGMFIRGLIHSDGCRVSNKVWHGKYEYPRYFFSNESADIQQLFRDGCDLIGVEYRNNRPNSISVAKRDSVVILDEIVGPKT